MEKISGIVRGSHRTNTVDASMSQPVRPGAPNFGRPEGKSRVTPNSDVNSDNDEIQAMDRNADRVEIKSRPSSDGENGKIRKDRKEASEPGTQAKSKNRNPEDVVEKSETKKNDTKPSINDPKFLAKMKEQANLRMISNLSNKFFERNYVEAPVVLADDLNRKSSPMKPKEMAPTPQQAEAAAAELDQSGELENAQAIREIKEEQPRPTQDVTA